MAQPDRNRHGLPPDDPRHGYERSDEQADREEARTAVFYTLKEIERAINQAEKAHQRVVELDQEPNLELALRTATERLESARKELFQSTYFGTDQQRLL